MVNTKAALQALDEGKIGGLGLDVYEKEKGIFFFDYSETGIKDELLKDLLKREKVIITPHQGFLTVEALTNISDTTMQNFDEWENGDHCNNELIIAN